MQRQSCPCRATSFICTICKLQSGHCGASGTVGTGRACKTWAIWVTDAVVTLLRTGASWRARHSLDG
eukprot:3532079-Prorocentrum_lima.AAC.1